MTEMTGEDGITIVQLPAWDLYRQKADDELGLRVFLSRRVLHTMFSDKSTAKYPLTVTIPDPKSPAEKRLVNLSAREEYYGRIACQK